MNLLNRTWLLRGTIAVVAVAGAIGAWVLVDGDGLPDGIAGSNGRIEAVEVDVATKIAGRVERIIVKEGEYVTQGQVLAVMDTAVLKAQQREAEAQLKRAEIGIETAKSLVVQREAEKAAAEAVVAQRQAQLEAARKRLNRTKELTPKGTVPAQTLDDDRATYEGARAAVRAAEAQVAAADAALGYANANVIDAQTAAEGARATVDRIEADIEDSTLTAPREGRVQYRVAEPGEIVAAGGTVLNLVDLTDVYMTFFLPTVQAGRVQLGSEARIILDAAPDLVIPAEISFVAAVAQFTPKTVETAEEREKLMFRIKARIGKDLLRRYIQGVKTGVPGMTYVKLDPNAAWPADLQVRLPE